MTTLRIVNDFEIVQYSERGKSIIIIRYLISGKPLTSSKYENISEEKVAEIKELLIDYTSTNRMVENLCQSIPLLTMIHEVERIIYDE